MDKQITAETKKDPAMAVAGSFLKPKIKKKMSKAKKKKGTNKTKEVNIKKAYAHLKWLTSSLPTPDTRERLCDEVKELIKEAVFLKYNSFMKVPNLEQEPMYLLSRNVGENLCELLSDTATHDWGAALYSYAELAMDLLELLAKPGVSSQMPENARSDISGMLRRLHRFFTNIDFYETHSFMDFIRCDTGEAEGSELDRLRKYYSFDKRFEVAHGSFFDSTNKGEAEARMQTLYNQLHKK